MRCRGQPHFGQELTWPSFSRESWEPSEPETAGQLPQCHQDGVHNASPDNGTSKHACDGYREANRCEEEGLQDLGHCWLVVMLVDCRAACLMRDLFWPRLVRMLRITVLVDLCIRHDVIRINHC